MRGISERLPNLLGRDQSVFWDPRAKLLKARGRACLLISHESQGRSDFAIFLQFAKMLPLYFGFSSSANPLFSFRRRNDILSASSRLVKKFFSVFPCLFWIPAG